jgi:hypothetical protein
MAEAKIINPNPYNDFTLLENTKKQCEKYLIDYENLPNNEDKFRDVYKVSEALESYPKTIEAFNLQKKQNLESGKIQKTYNDLEKQKGEENFKNFVYYPDFKIGLTLNETLKLYPEYRKGFKYKDGTGEAIGKLIETEGLPTGISIRNNIVYGYNINFSMNKVDDAQYSSGKKTISDILKRFQNEFIFAPTETNAENTAKIGKSDFYTKAIIYTWTNNNKTITLSFSQSFYLNQNLSTIMLFSKDENLPEAQPLLNKKGVRTLFGN